jgi:hypothetical protein
MSCRGARNESGFGMVRLTFPRSSGLVSLVLFVACTVGCGNRAELERQSIQNMEDLGGAIYEYYDFEKQATGEGKYPESLDLKEFQEDVGGPEVFKQIMMNPLTGDSPGYEYVKPPDGTPLTADLIILYQLRNGHRDVTLDAFALDGTVRAP